MSQLIKILAFCMLITYGLSAQAQKLKTIKPFIGKPNNFTKQEEKKWQEIIERHNKINADELQYSQLTEKESLEIDSLYEENGPFTEGMGCSWYCGGDMNKVVATDCLKSNGSNDYKADNIHDFNLFTAWVPDTTKGMIGKKVSFHFPFNSKAVKEINIYNGYIKNDYLFAANGRVKKFKLYVNGKAFAELLLEDTTAVQSFAVPALKATAKQRVLILTLEIIEIYKGDTYNEVAISEINFGGESGH